MTFFSSNRYSKHSLPFVFLFMAFPSIALAAEECQLIVPAADYGARLPLSPGMAVVTHMSSMYSSPEGPDTTTNTTFSTLTGWPLTILDLRDPANSSTESPSIAPLNGDNWQEVSENRYVHTSWTAANLGEVNGIALEEGAEAPDIFTVARGVSTTNKVYTRTGGNGSEVIRIDGTTGAVNVMKQLPGQPIYQTFTGLGQISYNKDAKVVYVSNLDNGLIYTLDASGNSSATNVATLSTFDHGLTMNPALADDPSTTHTPFGRMVMAVGYNSAEGRLYYSVPASTVASNGASWGIGSLVWSVPVNPDGSIPAGATPVLEHTYTVASNHRAMVTDIAFNYDGSRMLV